MFARPLIAFFYWRKAPVFAASKEEPGKHEVSALSERVKRERMARKRCGVPE
jgi:hypothetical protein